MVTCSVRANEPTIDFAHPLLLGGVLHLWLVEGIGDDDTEPILNMADMHPHWQATASSAQYIHTWGAGHRLEASVQCAADHVDLALALTNGQGRAWHNVHASPCLQFKDASAYYDHEGERSILYRHGQVLRVRDTRRFTYPGWWRNVQNYALAGQEIQTREGFSVPYRGAMDGRWGVSPDRVDAPLVAMQRRDEKALVGVAFQMARTVSKNYNDSHHCIHSTPYFGNLASGESARVQGRIWFFAGPPEGLLQQYQEWAGSRVAGV